LFIPTFVFGFWSLLVTKLRKYYVIFVYILQGKMGKTEKTRKKITKVKWPKYQKMKIWDELFVKVYKADKKSWKLVNVVCQCPLTFDITKRHWLYTTQGQGDQALSKENNFWKLSYFFQNLTTPQRLRPIKKIQNDKT